MEEYSNKLHNANDLTQMRNFIEDIIKDTNNMAESSRQLNQELEERNRALKQEIEARKSVQTALQKALAEIKTLRGIIPICSYCKGIRDDKGVWYRLEKYIQRHSYAEFSHGVCPKCAEAFYSKYSLYDDDETS